MATKRRLDALLVERGLVETRSRAQALVMAGRVHVDGGAGDEARARPTAEDAAVELDGAPAVRLARRERSSKRRSPASVSAPEGERCLDVGASTGGFTDCLLQHGAARVLALDVGTTSSTARLRADPRVTVIERMNARSLDSLRCRPPGAGHGRPLVHLAAAGAPGRAAAAAPRPAGSSCW